jgi:hypothetical protein
MSFTYDPTTEAGQVRLLIPDTDEDNQIFSDAEIAAFLVMPGVTGAGKVFRAAAAACGTIARSEALIQKVQETRGVKTNGAALAAEFRQQAIALKADALEADTLADEGGGFASQAIVRTDFQRRGVDYATDVEDYE